MKALFIGGTGVISTAITRLLAQKPEWELYLLNRGHKTELPEGVKNLVADINDEAAVKSLIAEHHFDVIADFIVMTPDQLERDIRLFTGKTEQYFFISSASAYQKPLVHPVIDEGTPLANPFWQYSRDKIACEERLMREYRERGFPVTIVRPSHTYGERNVPFAVHGKHGCWQPIKRLLDGKPIIIPGDGTSLWTLTASEDFAVGFVGLMGNAHALGQAVHITSDESLTWNQILGCVANALGVKPNVMHIASDLIAKYDPAQVGTLLGDKANSVIFDNRRLKSLVPEFSAQIRFDQGARTSIKNILADPSLQILDPEFDAWCDRTIELYRRAFPQDA